MTDTIDLICFKCKHFRRFEGGCEAFPEGIPDEVLIPNRHDEPLRELQDNDIVFEAGEPIIPEDITA